ncbi:acyl-CoA hydrolase [Paraburkholderia sp. GAS334]
MYRSAPACKLPVCALSRTIPDLSYCRRSRLAPLSPLSSCWPDRGHVDGVETASVREANPTRSQPVSMDVTMTENLPLPQKAPALRVMPQPSDANIHGDVFGGWIMAQVDIAGSIPASRRANGRVATIAVNSFLFKQPVFVGDLLSFYADIVKTGNTSVTVSVEVYAQRMSLTEKVVKVTEATLTYVATDSDRRPRALPALD